MLSIGYILLISSLAKGFDSSGLRASIQPSDTSGLSGKPVSSIALDQVLDGRNLTAVVVGAKAISNDTIQVVLEANITPKTGPKPVSSSIADKSADRLNVRLIYGAGDSDSLTVLKSPEFIKFFTNPSMLNKTNLELIPYGRAVEIDVNTLSPGFLFWHPELRRGNITRVYRCPNGESECESNLIHSCAVHVTRNDPSVYLPYIGCMSSSAPGTSPEDSSFACSNSTKFMETLKQCALGSDGIELQHSLARKAAEAVTIPSFYIDGQLHPFNVSGIKDLSNMFCDIMFANGILDRDLCISGKDKTTLSAPFESLLTPTAHVKS